MVHAICLVIIMQMGLLAGRSLFLCPPPFSVIHSAAPGVNCATVKAGIE